MPDDHCHQDFEPAFVRISQRCSLHACLLKVQPESCRLNEILYRVSLTQPLLLHMLVRARKVGLLWGTSSWRQGICNRMVARWLQDALPSKTVQLLLVVLVVIPCCLLAERTARATFGVHPLSVKPQQGVLNMCVLYCIVGH